MKEASATRNWTNIKALSLVHLFGLCGVALAISRTIDGHFPAIALSIGFVWYCLGCESIATGYHRYFAHRAFDAAKFLQVIYLVFGSIAAQGSAAWWVWKHRLHHAETDRPGDPHSILRGYWWAHVGWLLRKEKETRPPMFNVKDLMRNRLVSLQHTFHPYISVFVGFVVPAAICFAWSGTWWSLAEGVLIPGFARLMFQYHTTWNVNSLAHWKKGTVRTKPAFTAVDSWWRAFFTFGEGAGHGLHHLYPKNWWHTRQWYMFEPARWSIWFWYQLGMVWNRFEAEDLKSKKVTS